MARRNAYSNEEYTDMVLCLGWAEDNANAAARRYAELYPLRAQHPNPRTIENTVRRLRETGSVVVRNPDGGRQRQRDRLHDPIVAAFAADPTDSLRSVSRQVSAALGVACSYSTVQRVMKDDGQHAYHLRGYVFAYNRPFNHLLEPGDPQQRLRYCHWLVDAVDEDPNILDRILWTDESTFGRIGMFNQHNEHVWAHENPFAVREDRSQHRYAVNVWAGVIRDRIVGPFRLPRNLNAGAYLDFLQHDLPALLDDVLPDQNNIILMHDGAPAHFAQPVRDHLDESYPEWIGRGGTVEWPARSPDHNPLDYYVWGTCKEAIYSNGPPGNADGCWQAVQEWAENVAPDQIHRATLQVLRRARLCIQMDRGHFEQCMKAGGDPGDEVGDEELERDPEDDNDPDWEMDE
ncbi:histone-lysine N-methyltransferase SETMAR-like [Phymastichus coffea]|uniref:histone-lysine N-methyltransferase SETMAR-like n=1 Tax=Phymastichus coffea TaxID=108790 RepID=UPI00273A7F3E|nr:histone-lysine N-methyltransferase SETMAR-like [Phymastichus coffea]